MFNIRPVTYEYDNKVMLSQYEDGLWCLMPLSSILRGRDM
jgi:hypothetical protein